MSIATHTKANSFYVQKVLGSRKYFFLFVGFPFFVKYCFLKSIVYMFVNTAIQKFGITQKKPVLLFMIYIVKCMFPVFSIIWSKVLGSLFCPDKIGSNQTLPTWCSMALQNESCSISLLGCANPPLP